MSSLYIEKTTKISDTNISLEEIINKLNIINNNITSINNSVTTINKMLLTNNYDIIGEYVLLDAKQLVTINYSTIFSSINYSSFRDLGVAYNALKYVKDKFSPLIDNYVPFTTYVRICVEYSDNFTEKGQPQIQLSGNNNTINILLDRTWGGTDDNIRRFYSSLYTWTNLYQKFGDGHIELKIRGYDLKGTTSDYYPRSIKVHKIYLLLYNKYTG